MTQQICCDSIPDLEDRGGAYPVLPPGIHWTTLEEVERVFARTAHRRWLFEGLLTACWHLKTAGCPAVYIDGSFTTGKQRPQDYDMCWDGNGVSGAALDPLLLAASKRAIRLKYLGDVCPLPHPDGGTYLDFFQMDRDGEPKGILGVRLHNDPLLSKDAA